MTASSSSRLPCALAVSTLLCGPGQQLLFELLLNGEPLLVPLPSLVWDSSHMAGEPGAASYPACLLELGETARATPPVYLVTTPPTLHRAEAQGHSHKCETGSPCGRTTNPLQLCIHVWHRQAQQTRLRGSGTLSWRRLGQKSGLAESSGTVSTAPGLPAALTA